MIRRGIERSVDIVTTQNRIVLVVMLLLTAGVATGIAGLDTESQAEESEDDFPGVAELERADYIDEHYELGDDEDDVVRSEVYVRDDENVLSKAALLDSLYYQQAVLDDDALADALADEADHTYGVSNLVATQVAEDPNADLDEQIAALEDASDEEVRELVRTVLEDEPTAFQFMPSQYEPGSDESTDRRMIFQFEQDDDDSAFPVPSGGQEALYEEALDRENPEYFTLGEHAWADANQQMNQNTVQLILPAALLLIVGVLAFTYRDLVDVIIGLIGVVVSIIWMFGILGWLGVSAGMVMIIGPVLITGLSIDYGFHVFMRYREQRGSEEDIRPPMYRSVSSVAVAFGLVTVTAAVAFLSNLANPLEMIQELGVGITFGVISAFIIFTTLVPALKVSVDGLLERVGLDRRKGSLGHGKYPDGSSPRVSPWPGGLHRWSSSSHSSQAQQVESPGRPWTRRASRNRRTRLRSGNRTCRGPWRGRTRKRCKTTGT